MYRHVCTMFSDVHTVLPILVQVVRIPDDRKSDSAYTHASLGGGHHAVPPNACFNEQ